MSARMQHPLWTVLSSHDLLRHIVDQLHEDDAFAVALVCHDFRAVICLKGSTMARFPNGIRTRGRAALLSVVRLRWALRAGYSVRLRDMLHVAGEGRLDVLRWAWNRGCATYRASCIRAAKAGRLLLRHWNGEMTSVLNEWTCAAAAKGGHLHVLQWARQQGCPWDECTCENAAMGGHLHVLKWAKQHGCSWGWITIYNAAVTRRCCNGSEPTGVPSDAMG